MNKPLPVFQVYCEGCGSVFSPGVRTPLWWRAKQRADKGFLDALCVTSTECGCRPERHVAKTCKTPYRVFGYDGDCNDFDLHCRTFIEAITAFRKLQRVNVVFISGVSERTLDRLERGN